MSIYGRYTDNLHDALMDILPEKTYEEHRKIFDLIESVVTHYLYETLDMHYQIWEKLKDERTKAWEERNYWERIARFNIKAHGYTTPQEIADHLTKCYDALGNYHGGRQ